MPQTTTQVMFVLEHFMCPGKDSESGMFYQLSVHYCTRLCKEERKTFRSYGKRLAGRGEKERQKEGSGDTVIKKLKINHQVNSKGLDLMKN